MPVDARLANEIFSIEFWHIISLLLSVSVNYYICMRARKSPLLYTYLSTQLMLLVWIAAKIFKTVSHTIGLRWFFIVMQYFGASFLGPCVLLFAYCYSRRKLPKPAHAILTFVPALYCFLIVVTNPGHYLFYSYFSFYKDSFGDLFYINMTISYTYLTVSVILLSRGFFKMFGHEKKRSYLFAGAIIFPFIINIFYVFRLFRLFFGYTPLFDYTPIATNISLMLFTLAAMKYRFLDILPIAKRQIFDGLSDAVFVYGHDLALLDCNSKAELLRVCPEYGGSFGDTADTMKIGGRTYKRFIKKTKSFYIYRFSDVTTVNNMLDEIKQKNSALLEIKGKLEQMLGSKRRLIALKAGNFILQELHDVLGHAAVLSISSCEIEIVRGAEKYSETLFAVKKLLLESRSELRGTYEPEGNPKKAATSLMLAVDSLISSAAISGIEVDQSVLGEPFELNSETSQAIFRACQEAVTNALKHARASEVHIVLKYSESSLEMYVMDNGAGCENIVMGRGLAGMRERINAVGGTIGFSSDTDCGFRIYAKVERG